MRDRRPQIFASALQDSKLTAREKLLMVLVVTLEAEQVDGRRRLGSSAMRPDGQFDLHTDYLATALGTSPGNVKKIRNACRDRGHLSEVSQGTFGRPSRWQALVVRGDVKYGVRGAVASPLTASDDLPERSSRGDVTGPLAYRAPQNPATHPSQGSSDPLGPGEKRSNEESGAHGSFPRLTVCEWHDHTPCDDDCANHPDNRRRTA